MASRQGKIALQLTQWVGGTIIVLMFIFILADYAIQAHYLAAYQEEVAQNGAEGIITLFHRDQDFDETCDELAAAAMVAGYELTPDRHFVVYDNEGAIRVRTSGAPAEARAEENNSILEPRPLSLDGTNARPEIRRIRSNGVPAVAAVASFGTRTEAPQNGVVAYIVLPEQIDQVALSMWALRTFVMLIVIIGTMLAVRIPVKRFVVTPIDGLFMAAYAASKDDFQSLPPCPVDNEFTELYDMFNRLMGHLTDTRVGEQSAEKAESPADSRAPLE